MIGNKCVNKLANLDIYTQVDIESFWLSDICPTCIVNFLRNTFTTSKAKFTHYKKKTIK